jgi:tellurite resistance protein
MLADGRIDDREREQLEAYGAARGLGRNRIQDLIAAAQAGDLAAPEPCDREAARVWFGEMVALALADGEVTAAEKSALLAFGKKLSFSAYDINQVIARKRGELYRVSQQKIRGLTRG